MPRTVLHRWNDRKVRIVPGNDRVTDAACRDCRYLETYGFSPRRGAARRASATCELRFELSPSQRFYDDKVGVLQRAELVEEDEEDVGFEFCLGGEPDPEVMRFLRLRELDKADAFLLEAIFEREVWDFMDAPVSAENEGAALRLLAEECRVVAATLATPLEGEELERVRTTELTALDATLRWTDAQLGSLNTKEYYQERRLKDLGLDTEWSVDGAQWTASSSLGSTDW